VNHVRTGVTATLLLVVAAGVVSAASHAESPGAACGAQAQEQAIVVTPSPSGATAVPTTTASATETATPRGRQRAPTGSTGDTVRATASQLTAEGRPQPVDPQGEPVAGSAQLVFTFGTGRDAITRRQAFLLPADMDPARVTVTLPFQDVIDDEGRPLAPTHLHAVVGRAGPGKLVTIAFCVNPSAPEEMDAGTYTGTALVGVDDRVSAVTLQSTVQDDRSWLVALFALAGVIAGLFVRLFADKTSTHHIKSIFHVSRTRVIVTVGAGLVVGFYSVQTIYLDDPTFDANLVDLFRVTAEVFAGTLAAKTLTDLWGQQDPATTKPKPEAGTLPPTPSAAA
jgi:hypothetical protein